MIGVVGFVVGILTTLVVLMVAAFFLGDRGDS